jgi:hypothetical protein
MLLFVLLTLSLICVNKVNADSARYNMTTDNDDWWWSDVTGASDYTSTTVKATDDNSITPNTIFYSFFKFNTSGLVDNVTINELRFNFYGDSYTQSKSTTQLYGLDITNYWFDELNFANCNSSLVFGSAGWKNIGMASSCLQYVNKTGYTYIRISIPDAGAGKYRLMQSRAREYAGDYDAYLNISWTNATAPPSGMCGTSYTGTGDWYINSDVNCTNINYSGQNINGNIIVNGSYTFDITNQTLNISLSSKYISGLSGSKMIGVYT